MNSPGGSLALLVIVESHASHRPVSIVFLRAPVLD
jgi:hypothetical protein